jgi:hypothetical protein
MDPTPQQPELAMDHVPALELQMRAVFNNRWRRWHRASSYDEAVKDPVTRQLLALTVQHMPKPPTRGRR